MLRHQASSTGHLLSLHGIGRDYGKEEATSALRDISFTVDRGEFIAIVGASGAGKSTLLNVLGLLDTASTGSYLVDGVAVSELGEQEQDRLRSETFGFVFQESHMLLGESVAKNTALGLAISGTPPRLRPDIVAQKLSAVGLLHKASALARNLSGGERQRVAIARAMATAPSILLVDEPTGALDTGNSQRVLDILRMHNGDGVTVIMITHNAALAQNADRIIELSDGAIAADRRIRNGDSPKRSASSPPPRQSVHVQRRWSTIWERITSAISNHTVHAARAAMLLLAFTVGAGGLVGAIGLSQSAASQVTDRLDSAALDRFLVVPQFGGSRLRAELGFPENGSMAEVGDIIAERLAGLPGVSTVGINALADFGGQLTRLNPLSTDRQPSFSPTIRVADEEFLAMRGVGLANDASLAHFSRGRTAPVAAVGAEYAARFGIDAIVPGDQIWLGNTPVALAGVIERTGDEPQLASAVIVNPALAEKVRSQDFSYLVATAPGMPAQLAPLAGIATTPGDSQLFAPEIVADLRGLRQGVTDDLLGFVGVIAWVLLGLSSLSAATAAYLSVHARVSEIALRRALGESRRSVWAQFVLEGLVVGLTGGTLGGAIGVVLVVAVATAQGWTPAFDLRISALGVLIGGATSVLASLYPAAVAARQDPAIAVRTA